MLVVNVGMLVAPDGIKAESWNSGRPRSQLAPFIQSLLVPPTQVLSTPEVLVKFQLRLLPELTELAARITLPCLASESLASTKLTELLTTLFNSQNEPLVAERSVTSSPNAPV